MTVKIRQLTLPALAWAALLWAPGSATAQSADAQALHLRSLAATCAQCHGTDGRSVSGAAVPGLAGLQTVYFTEQMKAFKSGARTATVMHQLAKGLSDAQVDQLATYFSTRAVVDGKK